MAGRRMQGGGRRRVEVGHGVTLTPGAGLRPGEGAWLAGSHAAVPWGRGGVASIAGRASDAGPGVPARRRGMPDTTSSRARARGE
ncbi:hypothetical protein SFR_5544 [Streptomyces sp. FR-008]|nr:hypothetical protein SFR_5544 [Streptomyces sp. FR-008]